MILYTIVPLDEVLCQPEMQAREYRASAHNIIECVNLDGKSTVSRLISTDPHLYLDPRYAPGASLPQK